MLGRNGVGKTSMLRAIVGQRPISRGAIRLDGRDIKYTATAGTLPIRGDDGKINARMFYVAYTKDGEDPKTRPVSFLYNGGPGSATVSSGSPTRSRSAATSSSSASEPSPQPSSRPRPGWQSIAGSSWTSGS